MPAAIDALAGNTALQWIGAWGGMGGLASEDAFKDHVAALKTAAVGDLGPVGAEALDLLVDVALGSPARVRLARPPARGPGARMG